MSISGFFVFILFSTKLIGASVNVYDNVPNFQEQSGGDGDDNDDGDDDDQ